MVLDKRKAKESQKNNDTTFFLGGKYNNMRILLE